MFSNQQELLTKKLKELLTEEVESFLQMREFSSMEWHTNLIARVSWAHIFLNQKLARRSLIDYVSLPGIPALSRDFIFLSAFLLFLW